MPETIQDRIASARKALVTSGKKAWQYSAILSPQDAAELIDSPSFISKEGSTGHGEIGRAFGFFCYSYFKAEGIRLVHDNELADAIAALS